MKRPQSLLDTELGVLPTDSCTKAGGHRAELAVLRVALRLERHGVQRVLRVRRAAREVVGGVLQRARRDEEQ